MNQSSAKYFFLNSMNCVYFICGLFLVAGSLSVLTDSEKILISRLIPIDTQEPILYYVCLVLLALGLLVCVLSTVGCWAICTTSNCLLSFYVFGVILLLLGEGVIGIVTLICPEYLSLHFNRDSLVETWQRTYGVPGKEQFTVAIDLVQVKFECCGVVSGNDFGTSFWRLKNFAAPNLSVPLTCCVLDHKQSRSFLDPMPVNFSACEDESTNKYRNAKHYEGCFVSLENWLKEEKMTILSVAIINVIVQLFILFGVVSSCLQERRTADIDVEMDKPMTYKSHMMQRKY